MSNSDPPWIIGSEVGDTNRQWVRDIVGAMLVPANITGLDSHIRDIVGTMFAASGGSYDPVTQILIFPGEATPIAPSTDPRLVLRWDPDLTIDGTNYPARYSIQARDFPGPAYSTLSTPLTHAGGATWLGHEASSAHGKTALTVRLQQGQGGHWATETPASNRAEMMGPSDNYSGPISATFNEVGGSYWLAFDFAVDDDIITNTGVQSSGAGNTIAICGLHSQNWADDLPTWAHSSGQDSMRMWLKGRTLVWGHAAPGTGNWMRCDVRTVPLNTTFTTEEAAGSDYGLPREWQLMDLNADERVRVIAKVTLSNSGTYSPRTEIWTQQGAGALVKRVDYSGANTFSTGVRYLKFGQYAWETGSTWWGNKNTRTIRTRSMLAMRSNVEDGYPDLTESNLLAWLNR